MERPGRIIAVVVMAGGTVIGCSDGEGEPDRITRIDGPAQVDDDVTPEQAPDE